MPDTIVTCRDFLAAVEKNLYGWQWQCPNGGENCQYRHMVPAGYVLQRDQKNKEEEKDPDADMTLEEKIERDRNALDSKNLTPVTLETFLAWKKKKAEEKQKALEEQRKSEIQKKEKGNLTKSIMSGKALFTYDPTLFKDDDDAVDEDLYEEDQGEEETKAEGSEKKEEVKIDTDLFAAAEGQDEEVDFD